MDRKILIVIGLTILGVLIVLGFFQNYLRQRKIVTINKESDLETAVGKNVFMKTNLYADKLPILKLGNTGIYLWEKGENILSDNSRAITILRESGISRFSEEGVKVRVWGKLGKYESTHPADQLIHGHYEIEYYRMEADWE